MPRGRILELKNNYGIIDTDAYKVEHEWIPFRIEKSMLEEKELHHVVDGLYGELHYVDVLHLVVASHVVDLDRKSTRLNSSHT